VQNQHQAGMLTWHSSKVQHLKPRSCNMEFDKFTSTGRLFKAAPRHRNAIGWMS